ncbi:MAG: holo-[acyl-carrier-protein] synthase [Dehalococcoidia bacterium]|nr:holo-[acyl-carrier-protein] synthase [Dehalococcoidia bacterium]
MLTTGVDIVEVLRIEEAAKRWGTRFLQRIYTPGEIAYARGRGPQLAGRFAAKEAGMKALGTGVKGVGWKEIEVVRIRGGAPTLQLHGRAAERAKRLGLQNFSISISHSREYAIAVVVAEVAPKETWLGSGSESI